MTASLRVYHGCFSLAKHNWAPPFPLFYTFCSLLITEIVRFIDVFIEPIWELTIFKGILSKGLLNTINSFPQPSPCKTVEIKGFLKRVPKYSRRTSLWNRDATHAVWLLRGKDCISAHRHSRPIRSLCQDPALLLGGYWRCLANSARLTHPPWGKGAMKPFSPSSPTQELPPPLHWSPINCTSAPLP